MLEMPGHWLGAKIRLAYFVRVQRWLLRGEKMSIAGHSKELKVDGVRAIICSRLDVALSSKMASKDLRTTIRIS
jgi:hypothetical protein